ncbi:hypothetical protein SCHPADRAFT_934514 [Schizopora paradoxa]|uniref:Uncharacterized protein n=1 Tax=Schizopora paradoxa TaxID=27342 RepID=A0A0H2SFS6_9AGAM|nr:hypothetical protein SCHPADRAFT_934514 [Schizopora paradoxa]
MARPTGGNKQSTTRRRLTSTYPSFAFVMHRFWLFVQIPVRIQPAPSATRRPLVPPVYNTSPQRINLVAERGDDWAMPERTNDNDIHDGISSASMPVTIDTNLPNTPKLGASLDFAASTISLLSLGSSSK